MSEFGLNNKGHLILHKTQQCLSTIIQNILVYFSQLFTEGSKASFHPKLTQKGVTQVLCIRFDGGGYGRIVRDSGQSLLGGFDLNRQGSTHFSSRPLP